MSGPQSLNESHRRRLLSSARYADKLLSDIEEILSAAESKSPFPKYRPDLTLHQTRLIRSHISRFRNHLSRVLAAIGIQHGGPQFGALHSILVTLTFVRIAVEEMAPEHLRGYGELPDSAAAEVRGLCVELEGLLDNLEHNLALGVAADLQARLAHLPHLASEVELLKLLDRIVNENELAEFHAPLLNIIEKLESPRFEIAVFGRVSSGKSSLLNHILHTDVLPVGVNPITAVPTRLIFGQEARLRVSFADRQVKDCAIRDLAVYASEERNPGNELGVARLVVELPTTRLQDGLVLVDTPGLGTLATGGAAETMAYLPQCDLGIVLISAVSPLDEGDLDTLSALSQAGIPVMALLSKADLLSPQDLEKALNYTQREVLSNLGLKVAVRPVSSAPQGEELLESWFRDHLAPLYGRHLELAQESVRRKAAGLRESVVTALRAKLGASSINAASANAQLEEVERKLRKAAGRIEEERRFCLGFTDDVCLLGRTVLQKVVDSLLERRDPARGPVPPATTIVSLAVDQVGLETASQVSQRLLALAQELKAVLKLAAEALENNGSANEGSLAGLVREMPRLEVALPEFEIQLPWFRPLRGLARSWLGRQVRKAVAGQVEAGFASYGRTLQHWTRTVLADLQREFDARADAYRAQLTRLMGRNTRSPEERARIESALDDLGRFQAVGEEKLTRQTTTARQSEAEQT